MDSSPNEPHQLVALRTDRGMSQYQLARVARVSQRTISSIETGGTRPRRDIRRKLLKSLGQPFDRHREIFGD